MPATPAIIPRTQPLLGPIGVGSNNQVLSSDGVGGTQWVTASSGGVTDHGALTGLADDDHAQYVAINGRAGGQTICGGDGSGDNLLIRGNSLNNSGSVQIHFGNGAHYGLEVRQFATHFKNHSYGTYVLIDTSQTSSPVINQSFNGTIGWAPGTNVSTFSYDTTLKRHAAGVVKSNNALMANEVRLVPYTDATRPAAGIAGRVIYNSDDGNLNIDTGSQWVTPDGVIT